ncbi:MAG: hypothetical protein V7645_3066 [Actinomycetota bacterium]|jgi:hypothetical protein
MSDRELLRVAKEADLEAEASEALVEASAAPKSNANLRFYLAILGVLPWVGVIISASISRWAEGEQERTNELHRRWIEEHEERFRQLEATVARMVDDVAKAGERAQQRLKDDDYLALVRKGFRVWDRAETNEKRELVRRVLTNAACDSQSSDDFVRRFLEWVDDYSEAHLEVVRVLYKHPMSTRSEIWDEIHGKEVREDSSEADLFKLLVRDLSIGSVVRQHRQTDGQGNFLKKPRAKPSHGRQLKSAFDDTEAYVLTSLGRDFVHYALNEVVMKIGAGEPASMRAEPQGNA